MTGLSAPVAKRLVSAACVIGVLLVVGCTPQGSAPSASSGGAAIVERRCTVCHTIDRINSAKKDEAGWNATIDRMRTKGAVVNEQEQAQIIAYLLSR